MSRPSRRPAADVVVDLEVFGGPQLERALLADQFGDLVDAPVAELADGAAIDEHRRALVAQAGAGGGGDADQAVLGQVAGLDPQLAAQGVQQLGVAEHAVGDVVGEQHPVAADRLV
jgi:hypothetical protein